MNMIGVGQGKYNPEGNLFFLSTKCSSNFDMGQPYHSELHGCNTTPCPSNTKDDN